MFWTIGEQYYIFYYPIISYRKIKVYRVETMIWEDPTATMMSVELQYLLYETRYSGKIPTRICSYVESYVE